MRTSIVCALLWAINACIWSMNIIDFGFTLYKGVWFVFSLAACGTYLIIAIVGQVRKHRSERLRCPHCGSKHISRGWYARGWNEYCSQAAGDYGYYCYGCGKITWEQSHEEYISELPEWVRPYESISK